MDMSPSLVLPNIMVPEKVRPLCTRSFPPPPNVSCVFQPAFLMPCCLSSLPPPFFPEVLMVPVLPFQSESSPSPSFLILLQTYNSGSSAGAVNSLPASSQKRLDDSAARFTNANFQEVSSSHSSNNTKDGLAADPGKSASEVKNKKNSGAGHAVGSRVGRKSLTSSGKPLPSTVVTMATSSTSVSASTGPFHQGELMTANGLIC